MIVQSWISFEFVNIRFHGLIFRCWDNQASFHRIEGGILEDHDLVALLAMRRIVVWKNEKFLDSELVTNDYIMKQRTGLVPSALKGRITANHCRSSYIRRYPWARRRGGLSPELPMQLPIISLYPYFISTANNILANTRTVRNKFLQALHQKEITAIFSKYQQSIRANQIATRTA